MRLIGISRLTAAITLAVIFITAWQSQATAADGTIGPISGTVVDAKGNPAPKAKLWLLYGTRDMQARVMAETTADNNGVYRFDAVPWQYDLGVSPPTITAQDSAGRIGTSGMMRSLTNPFPDDCKITLFDGVKYQGRLLDIDGKPIANAAAIAFAWREQDQRGGMYSNLLMPPEMQKQYSTATDENGCFSIGCFPSNGHALIRFSTAEFGNPVASVKLSKSLPVKLARPGSVSGKFVCAKDARAVAGLEFTIYKDNNRDSTNSFTIIKDIKTELDGTFKVDGLQPGIYTIYPQFPSDFPFCVEEKNPVDVKSGEYAKMEIALVPGVKVKGKIVDKKTKTGVGGVRFAVRDSGSVFRQAVTDVNGEFLLYAKEGDAGIYILHVPEMYVVTNDSHINDLSLTEDTTVPTIELERAVNLKVLVLDESGKPAADAEVRYLYSESPFDGFEELLRTDKNGIASLGRHSPEETVIVRARMGDAAARQKLTLNGVDKPVELKLSKKSAFAVAGALADESGNPLANVEVTLQAEFDQSNRLGYYYSSPSLTLSDKIKTDEQGRFVFPGLWTDASYTLLVKTPGRERHASATIQAAAGKTHELGDISLGRTDYEVSGRVVGSDGNPIAAARVFNSGDGPELIETLSDESGRFRLKGFRKGPVYVFAVKKGRRFAAVKTGGGTDGVELKMAGADEPMPKTEPGSTPMSFEEEKKLARQLLDELWKYTSPKTKSSGKKGRLADTLGKWLSSAVSSDYREFRQSLVPLMERIDPKTAANWRKECGAEPEDEEPGEKKRSLEEIADADLNEAFGMLHEDSERAVAQLNELCTHFAKPAPEKALICAEEAVVRIRGFDQPARAMVLGNWSKIVSDLGQEDAGRQLLDEAIEMTGRWKPMDRYDSALQNLAVLAAPSDKDRAMQLVEKIKEEPIRQECLARMIGQIDNPADAEPVLKKLEPERVRPARLELAFNMAKKRPAEAVRLLDEILAEDNSDEDEAEQLVRMAGIIGKSAPELTHALIDRVFDEYLPYEMGKSGRWVSFETAALAALAADTHYPDMRRIVLQAFALRPVPGDWDSPIHSIQNAMTMAGTLAQVDPAAAAELLRSIEPNKHLVDSKQQWFRAWALADPRHAVKMAEAELAELKKGGTDNNTLDSLRAMIDLWTTPHENRDGHSWMFDLSRRAHMIEEEEFIMP